jgi:hypothetical protein
MVAFRVSSGSSTIARKLATKRSSLVSESSISNEDRGQQRTVQTTFPSVIDRKSVLKYGGVYRDHTFLQLRPIIDFRVAVVELSASVSCEKVGQES